LPKERDDDRLFAQTILANINQTTIHRMARGRFILLEGCDRAGKSTQCAMLVKALQERGHSVELCKFPGTYNTE